MATKRLTDADVRNAKAKSGSRIELWDEHTPGLCLRVTPHKKVWVVRYRAAGKQRRWVLGTYRDPDEPKSERDLDLARARIAAASVLLNSKERGDDPAGDKQVEKAAALARPIKTFGDLAEAYMEACRKGRWKPRGKAQSERTLEDAQQSLDRHILPTLGHLQLVQVTPSLVERLLEGMADRGISAQTNVALSVIRRIYNYAIRKLHLVAVNVADGQERQEERPRQRVFTDPELKALWAAVKSPAGLRTHAGPEDEKGEPVHLSRPMAILLQLAMLLLQRRNELAGMMASEVNLDLATWLIPAARMKARRAHLVPLPPESVKLIREAIQLAESVRPARKDGEKLPNDYPIFPSPRDRLRPIRPSSVTQIMKLVTRAIELEGVSPHDLRRTGSTALTSERIEVSRFIRSLVLAHAADRDDGGAAVTARHYDANDYVREKRRALEAWEGLLLEIVGERPRPSNVRPMLAAG